MQLQHEFVVPLSVAEARRLVTELERFVPAVPGLDLRITVHAYDKRSATIRLTGDLRPGGGLRRAVVVDLAARLLREYARRVQTQAQARTAQRADLRGSASPVSTADTVGTAGTVETAGTAEAAASAGPAGAAPAAVRGRFRRGGRAGAPRDVWAQVTDPIGGPGPSQPSQASPPLPVRRRRPSLPASLAGSPVTARDVVAVAGVAAAVAVAGRAVRQRQHRRRP